MTTTPRIGWAVEHIVATIKQGTRGAYRLTSTVTNSDGSPLATYDGWTSDLALYRTEQGAPEIEIVPTVTGDAANTRFIVDVIFEKDDTQDITPGNLFGDVCLISPDGDPYYPADIALTIERSYTPVTP